MHNPLSGSILYVIGINKATLIVAERPGRAPTRIPSMV